MKKIRILHVVSDDKFIDGPFSNFENDERFVNKAVMIVDSPDYKFRLIKNTEKIKLLYNTRMIKDSFSRDDYDAIFFYSLTDYHIFKYIPDDKIVIWWAWGFDIYGYKRFIDIPLFKPKTMDYLKTQNSSIGMRIKSFVNKLPFVIKYRYGSRKESIRRIDYFQPVIHTEYELMQHYSGFRAKEFYYPKAHNFKAMMSSEIPNHGNNILINHSATYTGNHLDVWDKVKSFVPVGSKVYFPINYGRHQYADYLSKVIMSKDNNLCFLRDFLPSEEYFKIIDSCSFAVFGVLREAAMGNIFRCLLMGVKLFLYKDSLVYKYLSGLGCIIFTIEDIEEDSFQTRLTEEQTNINRQCLLKDQSYVEKVREAAIEEIIGRIYKNI